MLWRLSGFHTPSFKQHRTFLYDNWLVTATSQLLLSGSVQPLCAPRAFDNGIQHERVVKRWSLPWQRTANANVAQNRAQVRLARRVLQHDPSTVCMKDTLVTRHSVNLPISCHFQLRRYCAEKKPANNNDKKKVPQGFQEFYAIREPGKGRAANAPRHVVIQRILLSAYEISMPLCDCITVIVYLYGHCGFNAGAIVAPLAITTTLDSRNGDANATKADTHVKYGMKETRAPREEARHAGAHGNAQAPKCVEHFRPQALMTHVRPRKKRPSIGLFHWHCRLDCCCMCPHFF